MESEQIIFKLLGVFALLCGVGLSFVTIDKTELNYKIHTMPGMALFRFPAYRWGAVLMCTLIGVFFLFLGFGWL